jgi:beta-glucanase (GH16 family)
MNKSILNIRYAAIGIIAIIFGLAGCKVEPVQTLPDRNYELVWSDDFVGDSGALADSTKWAYDLGTGQNGWGNNELQSYTKKPENISLDGQGNLHITAIKSTGGDYSSARIKTEGIFYQKFGRIEARIKTPTGTGIWPAFWMLGSNINQVGWPACGEIDIMEQKGSKSDVTYSSLHGPGYSGGQAITTPYGLRYARFDTDFHIYSVDWGENFVDFFVDNFLFKRLTPEDVTGQWVYNNTFFVILNVAVGGSFVGPPNANTPFPQSMIVDYVKVYKEL